MNPSIDQGLIREETTEPGSDRTFGLVIGAALLLVGHINGWHHGRLWPFESAAAAVFLLAALLSPSVLRPLNRLWMHLGLLLHRIINPIVMGLLFYGTIFPTGLAMHLRGRDLLRLKRDPTLASYWIARDPGPAPETMKDQF
jgi:hypothetical protein